MESEMNARTKLLTILGLTAALIGAGGAFAGDKEKPQAKAAKVGEKAPAWTLKDIKGKEWKSTDLANKIVVLEWVNPGCPVCKGAHQDGRIPTMVKELKGMSDVQFVAINSSHFTNVKENEDALKAYGIDYPVLLDVEGTVGRAFGAKTTPHIFVIDTQGVLRYQGALDNGGPRGQTSDGSPVQNYVLNAVNQIKAGETVSPENTTPYGCGVKYKQGEGEARGRGRSGGGKGGVRE
jgi:peroxiredoxin